MDDTLVQISSGGKVTFTSQGYYLTKENTKPGDIELFFAKEGSETLLKDIKLLENLR
jgi:hypothetical protein